jgi:hypothetical protein
MTTCSVGVSGRTVTTSVRMMLCTGWASGSGCRPGAYWMTLTSSTVIMPSLTILRTWGKSRSTVSTLSTHSTLIGRSADRSTMVAV